MPLNACRWPATVQLLRRRPVDLGYIRADESTRADFSRSAAWY
jgi:hypothetical protein